MRAFKLLHEHPHVRERTARRFQHVLVDEYQDTNFAQGLLLRLLVEASQRDRVGDDDRPSPFRGARRDLLIRARRSRLTTVKLERNSLGRRIPTRPPGGRPIEARVDKISRPSGGRVPLDSSSERAQAQAVFGEPRAWSPARGAD